VSPVTDIAVTFSERHRTPEEEAKLAAPKNRRQVAAPTSKRTPAATQVGRMGTFAPQLTPTAQ
jgi:hypothetical protein